MRHLYNEFTGENGREPAVLAETDLDLQILRDLVERREIDLILSGRKENAGTIMRASKSQGDDGSFEVQVVPFVRGEENGPTGPFNIIKFMESVVLAKVFVLWNHGFRVETDHEGTRGLQVGARPQAPTGEQR